MLILSKSNNIQKIEKKLNANKIIDFLSYGNNYNFYTVFLIKLFNLLFLFLFEYIKAH